MPISYFLFPNRDKLRKTSFSQLLGAFALCWKPTSPKGLAPNVASPRCTATTDSVIQICNH